MKDDELFIAHKVDQAGDVVKTNVDANPQVDWSKIKEILLGVLTTLDAVVALLPEGAVKAFVKMAIATLRIVVSQLPG